MHDFGALSAGGNKSLPGSGDEGAMLCKMRRVKTSQMTHQKWFPLARFLSTSGVAAPMLTVKVKLEPPILANALLALTPHPFGQAD